MRRRQLELPYQQRDSEFLKKTKVMLVYYFLANVYHIAVGGHVNMAEAGRPTATAVHHVSLLKQLLSTAIYGSKTIW